MSLRKTRIKRTVLILVIVLGLFNVYLLAFDKTYFYSALYHNFADIDDYKIFPNRIIKKSSNPDPWAISISYNKSPLSSSLVNKLESSATIAFLVIKDDSIRQENYWDGYSDSSISGSFSMAKSYVSALIGVALKEGKIKSVEQPVSDFLPWFKEDQKKNIKIKHLLTMSSGLEWDEAYANPLSVTTEAYYGNNLLKIFKSQKVENKPGINFSYKSGDTELLSFIVKEATGKSLAEYAGEKLWQPMGAERDALWSLDRENGYEKAYCCINSNARDFARLGYLYMHKGNWKGKQLIDSAYIDSSLTPACIDYNGKSCNFYGYQWWLIPDYKGEKIFYARGILGQMIIVVPAWNMIAVRLGKSRGEKAGIHWQLVYDIVDEMKKIKN